MSILNLETLKPVREIECHEKVTSICTHNNPALIISGGNDGLIKLWDIRKKDPVFSSKAHKQAVKAIDSRQNLFVSGGKEGSLKICDLRKIGLETVCCNEKVTDLSLSPGADKVAVVHSNSLLRTYNLLTYETISTTACIKAVIVKYKSEGLYLLSPNKLTVINSLGLSRDITANWSYPLHINFHDKVVSRELGIDVWEIAPGQKKTNGLDFSKLVI
jgi:WD40 repeat protein